MLKDNLTILIVLAIIGGTVFYIYQQDKQITDLKEMRISDVQDEINALDKTREKQIEKNVEYADEIQRLEIEIIQQRERANIYKNKSDKLYEDWEKSKLDPNDTALISIINRLKEYSAKLDGETSP